MKFRGAVVALTALVLLALAAPASAGTGLNAYKAKARGAKQLRELKRLGFDITEGQRRGGIEIVATKRQIRNLRNKGIRAKLLRDRRGRSATRVAAAQVADGWQVWRPYARTDVPVSGSAGNPTATIMTQLENIAANHPGITKLKTIGHSVNGVPIYAMKVTKDANTTPDNTRPAVLYSSVQHAREWLAGETGRRTLRLLVDNYGESGTALGTDGQPVSGVSASEITKLVDATELWFILVANPDGYDYTFDPPNRLWRKNLRDNNLDAQITSVDGVDPNRNFPTHWNYDNEGSSSEWSSETYRGTGPASEPETEAFLSLVNDVDFAWNKNDHTFGQLLLYPFGWQVDTHAADEPIFTTIAGDDQHPAIQGFDPDLGAELYTTNGDTNDHLYDAKQIISFTPEGTGAPSGSGFVFPDDERMVQAEFERHVEFALDLARSAEDPSRPESHLGNKAPNFVVNSFDVSFGDPQTVEVNARRDLGAVQLKYQIEDGPIQTAATTEWEGGERYGDKGDYWYHRLRGEVSGVAPGQVVHVWFEGGGKKSREFTYRLRSDSGDRVLILAAEDRTGNSAFPGYASTKAKTPNYLSYYTSALTANGITHDVYDFDAENRRAPDELGVLSHYDAVVWYTGNDNVTRCCARPGVADEAAHQMTMAVRDYLNEGGRLFYTGVNAGRQYDLVEYPQSGLPLTACDGDLITTDGGVCQPLSNDFLQYWLGSFVYSEAGGLRDDHSVRNVVGLVPPLEGMELSLNGADSAGNQAGAPVFVGTATHLVTSSVLDTATYPQFESWEAADWVYEGGRPFQPHTGGWYVWSQQADEGYKRLTRTVDMTGQSSGELSFWTSYNTELDWDFVFVEAREAGQEDWTTLPDLNGHTSTSTGASCPEGWHELHPHLALYQGADCSGTGADGGEWHADSGNSGGWQQWRVDLTNGGKWAGKQVEVSIVYATDWAIQIVPGVFVDDTTVTVGPSSESTSFEDGYGGWTVMGPHDDDTNANEWTRSEGVPFEDAAIVGTDRSLLAGFGLEGVNSAAARNDLMGRVMSALLD
jgi:murein tripeptide amidase MpaA